MPERKSFASNVGGLRPERRFGPCAETLRGSGWAGGSLSSVVTAWLLRAWRGTMCHLDTLSCGVAYRIWTQLVYVRNAVDWLAEIIYPLGDSVRSRSRREG